MLKDRQDFHHLSGGVLLTQLFASFAPLEGSTVESPSGGTVSDVAIPPSLRGEASARGAASSTLYLPEIPAFNPHRRRSSATHAHMTMGVIPSGAFDATKLAVTNTLMQQMCLLILQLCPTVYVIDSASEARAESSSAADGVKQNVSQPKGGINSARFFGKSVTNSGRMFTLNTSHISFCCLFLIA